VFADILWFYGFSEQNPSVASHVGCLAHAVNQILPGDTPDRERPPRRRVRISQPLPQAMCFFFAAKLRMAAVSAPISSLK
jgi:hypothetical protein